MKNKNLLNKINKRGRATKAVAGALSFFLIISSLDLTAFAYSGKETSDKRIVGISSLSNDIANQTVKSNASLKDVVFPETLDVYVTYQVEKEIEVEVLPSVEIIPSKESENENMNVSEEINEEENRKMDFSAEISEEDSRIFDASEQDASGNMQTEDSNPSDDVLKENIERKSDEEQTELNTYGEYDGAETVYVPMEQYNAEPSHDEIIVSTLENVTDESNEEETADESKNETQKEIIIEQVEEYVSVSATWSIDEEKSSKKKFKNLVSGEKYIFVPTITEKGYTLDCDIDLPVITVTVEEDFVTFEQSTTVDGVVITVTADEGVFPEGASVVATAVSSSEENEVIEAIDEVRGEVKNVAASYTFDITILDKNGNEIEPDTTKGLVKVTFKMAEIANKNLETDVYHLEETDDGLNVENLDVNTYEGDADEAVVETTGFSFYTVEFTYGELQYVLEGGKKVELTSILEAVGIAENGAITKVEGSNDELFKPVFDEEEKAWYIESLKAFGSEEWLKVTIDGIEYEIVVTDDATHIHDDISFNAWDSDNSLPDTTGDYYLTKDITLSGTWNVPSGNINLCLNGHVINGNNGNYSVITVGSGATLNLYDCDTRSETDRTHAGYISDGLWNLGTGSGTTQNIIGGIITGGNTTTSNGAGVHICSGGTFNMNGGTIAGCLSNSTSYGCGGGVFVDGGTFNMNRDASIRNCKAQGGTGGGSGNGAGVYIVGAGSVFTMNDNASIRDCVSNMGGGGVRLQGGSFTMNDNVVISGCSSLSGGGVQNIPTGCANNECIFTMNGGVIENNKATALNSGNTTNWGGGGICLNNGVNIINDGEVRNNTITNGVLGAGILIFDGSLEINNGAVSGNTGARDGGGIFISGGKVTMNGGSISNNTCTYSGAGIYINAAGSFYLNAGVIEHNSTSATQYGGGGICNCGVCYLNGGRIQYNAATRNMGGGVCLFTPGNTYINGCTISKNTAAAGGGVHVNTGSLSIGKNTEIYGNVVGGTISENSGVYTLAGGTSNNLYIPATGSVGFGTGENVPSEGMNIGVTMASGTGYVTGTTGTGQYAQYFSSDNENYQAFAKDTKVYIGQANVLNVTTYTGYDSIASAISAANSGDTIRLLKNITENVTVGKNITLDLNGNVLKGNGTGSTLIVSNGAQLTLIDGGTDSVHYYKYRSNGPWVWDDSASSGAIAVDAITDSTAADTPIIVKGGAITGGIGSNATNGSEGGGIYNAGSLIINGGNIVGNSAGWHGGGIYSEGSFELNGGCIVGNYSAIHGAGVFVAGLTMNEGRIVYNVAGDQAGGVYLSSGIFDMNGGIISYNRAYTFAGGVSVSGTMNMYGGEISYNKTTRTDTYGYAGGVHNQKTMNLYGGSISNNSARYGGGIYNGYNDAGFNNPGELIMVGGTVTGNNCSIDGGGIYYKNGSITFGKTAQITGNTKGTENQNVYLPNGLSIAVASGSDAPATGMNVGVTLASGTGNVTGTGAGQYAQYFSSDNATYTAVNDGNIVKLSDIGSFVASVTNGNENTTWYTSLQAAINAVNSMSNTTESGTIVKLLKDHGTSEKDIKIYKSCTIDLGGHTLSNGYGGDGCLIQTPLTQDGGITIKNGTILFNLSCSIINTESESAQVLLTCDNISINCTGNAEAAYVNWGDAVLFKNCTINSPILASGYNSGGSVGTVTYDDNSKIKYNTSLTKDPTWGQEKIIFKESYHQKSKVRHYSTDTKEVDLREFIAPGYMWIDTPVSDPNHTEYPYKVVKSKTVILDVDNGSVSSNFSGYRQNVSDDTVYCFADSFTLPIASEITRSGYTFDGWYNNANFTGSKVTSTTENGKTYYAKWIRNTASVTHEGNVTYYDSLQKAVNAATDGDTVQMLEDTTEKVTVNKKITLDLNGKVLKGTSGSVITVYSGIELTLKDSNPTKVHYFNYIKNGAWTLNTSATSGISIDSIDESTNDGTIIAVTGGVITGGNNTYGGGVNNSGSLIISGGNIVGNTASSYGGGVCVSGGNLTMNGGKIIGNFAGIYGGGVYVSANNRMIMDGGAVSYNTAKTSGGGVFIPRDDSVTINLTINNGSISNNRVTNGRGGGVFAGTNADVIMAGGEIFGNYACDTNASEKGGGGVMTNGSFKMTGGKIAGNKIESGYGGGVYRYPATTNNGATTIGGTAIIENNVRGTDSTDNLYLTSGKLITVATGSEAPQSGMNVGVTTATAPTVSVPVAITGDNGDDYSNYFVSDKADYLIRNDGNVVKLMKAFKVINSTSESDKANNHGYISIDKSYAIAGETITVTVTPGTAYSLKSMKYNDGSEDHDITSTKSFSMPGANVTVTAVFEHIHSFTYTASENVLKATCIEGCSDGFDTTPFTLTLTKPSNLVYDGAVKVITFAQGESDKWSASDTGLGTVPAITYEAKSGSGLTDGKPVNVGNYTASVTASGITASLDFEITKASSSVNTAPTANSLTYNGNDQALVSAGTASGGTMNYAIGADASEAPEQGWSASIPTGKNAGTYFVWYKSVGDSNHSDSEAECVTLIIAKANHEVTAPTALNPTYNGMEKVLISAGSCATGEILYSLSENGEYTSDINAIKAKAVGTYTVYYKILGDANYNDYETKSITAKVVSNPTPTPNPDPEPNLDPTPDNTTPAVKLENPNEKNKRETDQNMDSDDIKETENIGQPDKDTNAVGKGNIRVEVETSDNSPIQGVKIETQIDEMISNSNIFTKKEIEEINLGTDAKVWIKIDGQDMALVSEELQGKAQKIAESLGGENAGFLFFDIQLLKQVGNGDIINIHESGTEMEVSMEIPEAIKNTNPNVKREYSIIRIQDGVVENLGGIVDEKSEYIEFSIGEFSTCALVYADTPIGGNLETTVPKLGIIIPLSLIMILLLGVGFIVFVTTRRKNQNDK